MATREVDDRGSVGVIVVAAVLAAVLVAAAVWLLAAPAAPTGEPIGTDAGEQYAAIDGVAATETTVVERGDQTTRTVATVAFRPGTELRREEVVSGDRRYDLTVSNESALWLYDEDADAAKLIPLSSTPSGEATRGDRIERLFAALHVTRADATEEGTLSSVAPLPVVPETKGTADAPWASASGPLDIQYDGTASVGDREAYVLHVAPAAATDATYNQTLWVDAETFFPLQQHTAWVDDGTPVSVTTTYEDVTFDPGLNDAAFRFDPPASASVERVETPNTETFDSVAALRERAAAPVPDLDLPPSFELTYATETTGRIHGAGVRYANETALVTAATYNRTVPAEGDRTVTVGDHEAVVDIGPTTSVSWNCGDYRYTVRGEGVSVSFLVEVGRSVDCG